MSPDNVKGSLLGSTAAVGEGRALSNLHVLCSVKKFMLKINELPYKYFSECLCVERIPNLFNFSLLIKCSELVLGITFKHL